MRRIVWFSCGAASAVAAKLAIESYGDGAHVVYCDTMATEHPDNARFFRDVERWLGRGIEVIRSADFATVDEVFERTGWMSSPKGARCTTELKKLPRKAYQRPTDVHLFGYTFDERQRAEDFEDAKENRALQVEWILIEREVTKAECLYRLELAGIELPAMYRLGFDHNNCIGCVKSGSAGYWNRTRRLFPEVFARRVRQSRALGVRLVKLGTEVDGERPRLFLDELPPDADAPDDAIECGPVCQRPLLFESDSRHSVNAGTTSSTPGAADGASE